LRGPGQVDPIHARHRAGVVAARAPPRVHRRDLIGQGAIVGQIVGHLGQALVDEAVVVGRVGVDPGDQPEPILLGEPGPLAARAVAERLDQLAAVRAELQRHGDAGVLAHVRPGHQLVGVEGVVGAVVARGESAGEIQPGRRLQPRVAARAVLVEHRLHVAQEADRPVAPGRGHGNRGLAGQGQREGRRGPGLLAGLVAADAGAGLARLEADERPHAPQLHVVGVEELEVEGRIDRHAEMRAAIGLDRHLAQHADRVPVDHHRLHVRLVALPAVGVAVGPGDALGDAQVLGLRRGNARGPLGRVLQRAEGVGDAGVGHVGQDGRAGPGPQRNRMKAGDRRIAVDQLLGPVDVDQVEGVSGGVDLLGRQAVAVAEGPVGGQERGFRKRPGVHVVAGGALHAALGHGQARHPAFRRQHARRDDADAPRAVHAVAGVDEDDRAGGQGVVARGHAHQPRAPRDRAAFLHGPRVVEVLLEQGVGAGAVGPDGPQRLDVGPAPLLVFPAGVADRAVVEGVGQVVAVLGDAHAADIAPVGPHHVEVRRGLVLVVLVALERIAATLGDEHDVAVGAVGGVQVAPLARGQLAQVAAVGIHLEDVRGLFAAAELEARAPVEPPRRRLGGLGLGVAEHDPAGVPPQVDPVHVPGPEPPVEHGLHLAFGLGAGHGEEAHVAAGPRHPGHVVQAHVRIALLCESLHEQQPVEAQRGIRERHAAGQPAGLVVEGLSRLRIAACRLLLLGERIGAASQAGSRLRQAHAEVGSKPLRATQGLVDGRDEELARVRLPGLALGRGDDQRGSPLVGHLELQRQHGRLAKALRNDHLALEPQRRQRHGLHGQVHRRVERFFQAHLERQAVLAESHPQRLRPHDLPILGGEERAGLTMERRDLRRKSGQLGLHAQRDFHTRLAFLTPDGGPLGRQRLAVESNHAGGFSLGHADLGPSQRHQLAAAGPGAAAALVGGSPQRQIVLLGLVGRAVDLHLVQMKENGRRAGQLDAQVSGVQSRRTAGRSTGREIDHQRLVVADAAERPAFVVVAGGPGLAVVGGEHD